MARYFFDVHDGSDSQDRIEHEIDDPQSLFREALRVTTHLAAKKAEEAQAATLLVTVRDDAGRIPLKVRLVCQVETA